MEKFTVWLACLFWFFASHAQAVIDVQKAFLQLNNKPTLQRFAYTGKLPKVGGHLQGIQIWQSSSAEYPVLTGSSGNLAYCLIVKQNHSDQLQLLDTFPFRHAGGCQVAGNQLLVGVEDNIAKAESEIVLVQLNDTSSNLLHAVLAKRNGIFKRSTAGATAACYTSATRLLVAVGDWDTQNIDFYNCSRIECDSVNTIQVPDSLNLPAYQAINLLQQNGTIYLVGFAQSGNRNRADLLQLELSTTKFCSISPVASYYFDISHGASFRYGAGLSYYNDTLCLYATQRNLKRKNIIAVYR